MVSFFPESESSTLTREINLAHILPSLVQAHVSEDATQHGFGETPEAKGPSMIVASALHKLLPLNSVKLLHREEGKASRGKERSLTSQMLAC